MNHLMQPSQNFEALPLYEFQLVFATQNNHIVNVAFDRCYLQKNKSITVKKSNADFLSHLNNQQVRAFDIAHNPGSNQDFFVIGSSAPVLINDKQAAQNAID